jgi:hypothetical protein
MTIMVELACSKKVNLLNAALIDVVGSDNNMYRIYRTVSAGRVLLQQKKGIQTWEDFNKPNPEIVAKMDALRPKEDHPVMRHNRRGLDLN